jgi:hypothetical protein
MILPLWLLIEPSRAWDYTARRRLGLGRLLFTMLLPYLVLSALLEGAGLHYWGKQRNETLQRYRFSLPEVTGFEILQVLLTALAILLTALAVRAVARSVHGRQTFQQTFTVTALATSHLIFAQTLNAFPVIPPWVAWCLGIALVARALYLGIPRVLQPDPPNAFGLYLMGLLLLTAATGLARFFTAAYLSGDLPALERPLTAFFAKYIS